MARYIDADDEIRKLCVLNCGCEPCECGHTFEENGTEGCTLVDFINDQPTADVVERKTGKWVERKVAYAGANIEVQSARCSVCNRYHTTPYLYSFYLDNYCPNCGARMEVEP